MSYYNIGHLLDYVLPSPSAIMNAYSTLAPLVFTESTATVLYELPLWVLFLGAVIFLVGIGVMWLLVLWFSWKVLKTALHHTYYIVIKKFCDIVCNLVVFVVMFAMVPVVLWYNFDSPKYVL